jgi:hypothetical protein
MTDASSELWDHIVIRRPSYLWDALEELHAEMFLMGATYQFAREHARKALRHWSCPECDSDDLCDRCVLYLVDRYRALAGKEPGK